MIKIELIFDADCPNADGARMNLDQALKNVSLNMNWTEWKKSHPSSPEYVKNYGSPTILINGNPIGKEHSNQKEISCNIYRDEDGKISHVPSINQIQTAIQIAMHQGEKRTIISLFTSAGTSGFALIPLINCPLCWPAYSAFLSAIGIGFINYTPYLIPLLIILIGLMNFMMWRDYQYHKRKVPLLLACISGAVVIIAKIVLQPKLLIYIGIAGLISATILNLYYIKKIAATS